MRHHQKLRALICLLAAALVGISAIGCSISSLRDLSFFTNDTESESNVSAFSPSENSVKLTIWHDSLEAAQRQSEESGKPILADFTGSDWCSWCKKLKRDVFDTDEFRAWARENVVLLELDFPRHSGQSPEIKSQNKRLKRKYAIQGYPTVLLLAPEGDVIGKLGYEKTPGEWIQSANVQIASRSKPTELF